MISTASMVEINKLKIDFISLREKKKFLNKLFKGPKNHAIKYCRKIIGFTCILCIA